MDEPWRLEDYRPYLHVLARRGVDVRMRAKFDASDVVQDALLRAHERLHQFRGKSEAELKSWLRSILATSLTNSILAFTTQKRDAGLERALQDGLSTTSFRLEQWLAGDLPSPSDMLIRNERMLRLTAALSRLPDDQRTALELRYLQEYSVDEIGREMQRSTASVAGLLRRGIAAMRAFLQ